MESQDPTIGATVRFLCHLCVGEAYLSAEMKQTGRQARCSYCGKTGIGFTISELTERIEEVFERHYRRTSDVPDSWELAMSYDGDSSYDWKRAGEPATLAIMNAADIPQHAAEEIRSMLNKGHLDSNSAKEGEEAEFSPESYYEEKGNSDDAWQEEWHHFERSLKNEARFFSRESVELLRTVFQGIDGMSTSDNRPLIIDAGPDTTLTAIYRARVFQSDARLIEALCKPDQHLGPPPASHATAGRMNAHGISVFYGANKACVTIAEVRPPVGSQVAVARFEIVRPIRLLDLTALGDIEESGSVFDPDFSQRLERAMFLRSLARRVTRPIMPDDEIFDYLPTQAIADFLATEGETPIDGIAFPSVQSKGKTLNVVLFHKAACVESVEVPPGTKLEASTGAMSEDGRERNYRVIESVPLQSVDILEPVREGSLTDISALLEVRSSRPELFEEVRKPALRVDLDSVEVHVVREVSYTTERHGVHRHRLKVD